MTPTEEQLLKTHIKTLYESQKSVLTALDETARSLEAVLKTLGDTDLKVPAPLRKSLATLAESLEALKVSGLALDAIDANVSLLNLPAAKFDALEALIRSLPKTQP